MDTTFLKGITVMETLATSERPRGVAELSRQLGLSKSNTHRLLQSLVTMGYAESSEGRYRLTPKIWRLGVNVIERLDVRSQALGPIRSLAEETKETVHLAILEGNEVTYLEKIDSPQPIRAYTRVGGRAPAYAVATGKAMLAFQPEARIASVMGALERYTPNTLADPERLAEELAKIRADGYAVNLGEWRAGVGGVAAPIYDAHGAVTAAVGVSGPVERLTPGQVTRFAALVGAAARRISLSLGASGR
jgi:DNA-binding IclR family transcriptional regulator